MEESVVLFDKDHVKSIEYEYRIPPTSIGVRRRRPSSKTVMNELKNIKRKKKKQKQEPGKEESDVGTLKKADSSVKEESKKEATDSDSKYFQFSNVDNKVKDEIEELTAMDRSAYKNLPAFLTLPMMIQAQKNNLLERNPNLEDLVSGAEVDDELAQKWADEIKISMKEAEVVRSQEEMRPMAYKLIPEPWKRLRDQCHKTDEKISTANIKNMDSEGAPSVVYSKNVQQMDHMKNIDMAIIYDCLYNSFNELHISCGAKFGCDYLLYDGNRSERHAFAGLRVLSSTKDDQGNVKFSLPTAYDLQGYVRGLNTAGKLALLATVIDKRVLVVDLALEKILSAPTHRRKRSTEARKAIGQNLNK